MYFRCIDEQHRLMELPSISSVTNLQDRQQVVKQTITAGKGSLTTSTVKFIQGLPNNHPLHWVYHVPKGPGSGKYSICPCSPVVSPWRNKNDIVLGDHYICTSRSKFFTLDGMVKHLYDKSGNDPYHKAAYDYLSSLYKGWRQPSAPPTNEETCSTQPNSQSDVLPARNQSASTNGIPPSLDQAFGDYSNVQQKSSTLESDAPPGPHAGESLSSTNNHDADSFYTVRVTFSGSLGIACDFENGSVYSTNSS